MIESKEELISALESGDLEVYDVQGGLCELSANGAELCHRFGISIDVDAYGCAFAVDHLIK